MSWIDLISMSQLEKIDVESRNNIVCIFKHSTRCSISDIALTRLKKSLATPPDIFKFYFLDLIEFREISNEIAKKYHVFHESPQILLIKDGECFFDCSHLDISWPLIMEQIERETLVS